MSTRFLTLIALLTGATPLVAQTGPLPVVRPPATSTEASQRLRYAARLPIRTTELRNAGVHDTTIHRVLEVFRQWNLDPVETDAILLVERDAARDNGPTDNFGAFVQQQLAAGKRGPELAAAIRAEHEAHGRGNAPARARREQATHDRDRTRANERDNVGARRP